MDNVVTLLSLFLTPLLVIASGAVVYLLWHPFLKAWKETNRNYVEWMIIGIVINFLGTIFDNAWWFLAWSYQYIDPSSTQKEFFFHYGVYSNTIFRQMFGIVGAMCHVYAASGQESTIHKSILYIGAIVGFLQVMLLMLMQTN